MATITELQNNITGLSFRTTLNNNYQNLNNDKVELTAFNTQVDRIDTAETDIDALDTLTTTHTADISSLETRMDAAEGLLDFDYETVTNEVITSDSYVEVINREFALTNGVYKIDMSAMFTMSSISQSAYFRFSLDNGVTWREVIEENKDLSDVRPLAYSFMFPVTNNTLDIQIQTRVENTGPTLTIQDMTVMVDRKA
jgi:hypothetical protein